MSSRFPGMQPKYINQSGAQHEDLLCPARREPGESPARNLEPRSQTPFDTKGRQQAFALADALQSQSISHIYSSPVLRALETTVIVANHLGIEYEVTEALREYDLGDLEGRSDPNVWELWQELFDNWMKYHRWERRAPGGESFYDVQARFVPFIDNLIRQYQGTAANLLCLGHGGLYWVMLPRVLKNIDTDFVFAHPAFNYGTTIVAEWQSGALVCLEWHGIQVA